MTKQWWIEHFESVVEKIKLDFNFQLPQLQINSLLDSWEMLEMGWSCKKTKAQAKFSIRSRRQFPSSGLKCTQSVETMKDRPEVFAW